MDQEMMTTAINQYLTFQLNEEVYAFPIQNVREVLQYEPITRVPNTPKFMCGIINLRGSVVPVVDLRVKFSMGQVAVTLNTSIVVIEVMIDDELTILGVLVDAVLEVLELEDEAILPPPRLGTRLNLNFIRGVGKRGQQFFSILDMNQIFTLSELGVLEQVLGETV